MFQHNLAVFGLAVSGALSLLGCGPGQPPVIQPATPTTTSSDSTTTVVDACVEANTPPFTQYTDEVLCSLRNLPESEGLSVREGRFRWLSRELCARLVQRIGSCLGNHPASPYGMFEFPEDSQGFNFGYPLARYRLAQNEALVYIGKTPPQARYFGFTQYQMDRDDGPDRPRRDTFGSIGPTLNHRDIQVAPGEDGPFEAYTVVIFTANTTTADRLVELIAPMLERAGYDPGIINVSAMAYIEALDGTALRADASYDPDSIVLLDMGYHNQADTYMGLIRVGAVVDQAHPYFDTERIEAGLFKISLDEAPEYAPFEYPHLPPDSETGQAPDDDVIEAVALVAQTVEQSWPPQGSTVLAAEFLNRTQKSGFKCINATPGHPLCGANNDDARYVQSGKSFRMPNPSEACAIVVVGAVHDEVGRRSVNAPQITYSSLTLSSAIDDFGVETLVDRDLEASYAYYFPTNELNLSADQQASIYLHKFSRVCPLADPFCTEVPMGADGISPNEAFKFLERVYLNETSGTAPDEPGITVSRLIAWGTTTDSGNGVTALRCP